MKLCPLFLPVALMAILLISCNSQLAKEATPTPTNDVEPQEDLDGVEAALSRLSQVTTAQEETAVFEAIWNDSSSLGFAAYDANDDKLPVSNERFPKDVAWIRLRVNGQSLDYHPIDPENIFILMRE